jgi:hypothetical protein
MWKLRTDVLLTPVDRALRPAALRRAVTALAVVIGLAAGSARLGQTSMAAHFCPPVQGPLWIATDDDALARLAASAWRAAEGTLGESCASIGAQRAPWPVVEVRPWHDAADLRARVARGDGDALYAIPEAALVPPYLEDDLWSVQPEGLALGAFVEHAIRDARRRRAGLPPSPAPEIHVDALLLYLRDVAPVLVWPFVGAGAVLVAAAQVAPGSLPAPARHTPAHLEGLLGETLASATVTTCWLLVLGTAAWALLTAAGAPITNDAAGVGPDTAAVVAALGALVIATIHGARSAAPAVPFNVFAAASMIGASITAGWDVPAAVCALWLFAAIPPLYLPRWLRVG